MARWVTGDNVDKGWAGVTNQIVPLPVQPRSGPDLYFIPAVCTENVLVV